MANETVVRVTADATGYASALEKAQRSNQAFLSSVEAAAARTKAAQDAISEAAENGSNASSRSINAFIQSLSRQADAVGKARSDLLQLQAAQMGVASSAQPFIDKIKAAEEAMTKGGHAAEGLNFSTAAARRELLVLVHEASQGNWTKFGGSIMVLGERIDAMSLIFSRTGMAIGGVGAVIAAVGYEAYKGYVEADRLNKAIELTGNFAGTTRTQLDSMAASIGASHNEITRANDVLTGFVESGRVASGVLQDFGAATLDVARRSGQDADKVVADFVKMTEGVTKWAEEHNKQYHFLTEAEYEHIKRLEEEGRAVDAQKATLKALSDFMGGEATTNIGIIATSMKGWKDVIEDTTRALMDLGKASTESDKMQSIYANLTEQQKRLDTAHSLGLDTSKLEAAISANRDLLAKYNQQILDDQAIADKKSKDAQIQQAGIAAKDWIDKEREKYDKVYAKQKELAEAKRNYDQLIAANPNAADAKDVYDGIVAGINDKYKDNAPKHEKAYTDDAATRFLQQLRDQDAALQAQLSTTGRMSEAEKELVKFDQQISDWKGKTLTADQKSLLSRQDELRAQLQVNVAHAKAVEQQEAINKLKERSAQIDASIASYQDKQRDQYGRQLEAFGMGSEALKNVQAVKSIYAEYQRLQEQLDKATPKNLIGGADYAKASADIKAGLDQSLADYDAYYAALKEKQADWTYGATEAIANYVDAAHNMAAQTQAAVTNMGKGMEDAITTFVTTGKLSFSSLADSIISDIVRMQARAAVSGLFSSISGWIGSAIGGGIGGDVTGSFGSLASTSAASSAASDVMGASYSSAVTGPSSLISSYASLPQRASGGPVADGSSYLVGEHGPEMFVPSQAGSIVANKALGGSGPSSIRVELVNEGSQQSQVKSATPQFDATGMVLKIILTDLQKGGPVRSAIQNLPKP
ncbi:phage tail tape measure protein [Pandoraea terrigena]|nr:phage tail tape measure protein [Pandoraea terrigena]